MSFILNMRSINFFKEIRNRTKSYHLRKQKANLGMRRNNRSIPGHSESQTQEISNDYQKWKVCLFTGGHYDRFSYRMDGICAFSSVQADLVSNQEELV